MSSVKKKTNTLKTYTEKPEIGSVLEITKPIVKSHKDYNGLCYKTWLIEDTESPTVKGKIYKKGTWYTGSHGSNKPEVNVNFDDGYHQTSKNKDFELLFAGSKKIFKTEIFYLCDNFTQAQLEESRILHQKKDEIKAGMSFNSIRSLNFTVNKTSAFIDADKCDKFIKELKQSIKDYREEKTPKYKITMEDKNTFSIKGSLQVKGEEDAKHVKQVADRIDDAKGNTDLKENQYIDPIMVIQNLKLQSQETSKDTIGNGNVTHEAIGDSKHATHFPICWISEEQQKEWGFNENEWRHNALMLNAPEKKVVKRTGPKCASKLLYRMYKVTGEYDTPANRDLLKIKYNFDTPQITKTMEFVDDKIFADELEDETICDYKQSDLDKIVAKKKKEKGMGKSIVFYASAGMGDKLDCRVSEAVLKDIALAKEEKREPYTDINMMVHYGKSKNTRAWWRKDGWSYFDDKFSATQPDLNPLKKLLKSLKKSGKINTDTYSKINKSLPKNYTLDYTEIPLTRKDTK